MGNATKETKYYVSRSVRRNAFEWTSIRDFVEWKPGMRIVDLLPSDFADDLNVRIIHNSTPRGREALNDLVLHGESVAFIAIPAGEHTNAAISAVIGSIAIAASILFPPIAPVALPLGIGFVASAVAAELQLLLAPSLPGKLKLTNDDLGGSPTYSLDGLQNTVQNGLPIPVIYGKHRVGGQIINQFFRVNDQGKSTLYVLVALSHGPVKSICGITADTDQLTGSAIPSTLELNGTPATNFGAALRVSVRMGGFNQDPIPGFNNVITTQSVGTTLAPNAAQTVTTQAPCSSFEVNISHPSGLYKINSANGNTQSYSVTYQVRWREGGGNGWFSSQTKTVTEKNKSAFLSYLHVDAPLGKNSDGSAVEKILDIEVTRTTAADNNYQVSTIELDSINEIRGGDIAHIGLSLLGLEALVTEQVAGGIQTITSLVEGKLVPVWDGVSTTSPVFNLIYDDGVVTKEDTELTIFAWQALRSNAGTDDNVSFQFYTSQTRTLNAVLFTLRKASTTAILSGNCYVEIQTDSSGVPSGTVVATSESRSMAKVKSNPGEIVSFAFASPPSLTAGAPYHAVLVGTYTVSATHHIQVAVAFDTTNPDMELKGGAWSNSTQYRVVGETIFKGRRPGENPAWWTLDFLVNKLYGLGPWVSLNDLNTYLSDYLTWANYCDDCYETYRSTTKSLPGVRFAGGYVIDVEGGGWEHALKLALIGNAALVPVGRSVRPIVDKPTTFSQLFTEGNVAEKSFRAGYVGLGDRYNRFEVQFANEDIGYNKDIAVREDPTALASGDTFKTETSNTFGITTPWRAYSIAQRKVNIAKNINRIFSFVAPLDAITCEVGDIIKVVHPARSAYYASTQGRELLTGRVVAATSTTLDLDCLVTTWAISPSPVAKLFVRTTASGVESIQERDVSSWGTYTTNTSQTYSRITVSSAWTTTPSQYDIYGYTCVPNAATTEERQLRVLSMRLTDDLKVEIGGVNYTTNIYDDDPGEIETFTDELPLPERVPDSVSDLKLSIEHGEMCDGNFTSSLIVSFSKPRKDNWAEVFYRINGDSEWVYHGRTDGSFWKIENVECGTTYDVTVRTASATQARESLDTSPRETLTIVGPWAVPNEVTNLTARQNAVGTLLCWTAPSAGSANFTDPSASGAGGIEGYEIRRGNNWNTGELVGRTLGTTFFTTLVAYNATGTFYVSPYTKGGVYSTSPASASLIGVYDYFPDIFNEDQASAPSWNGTKTNCAVVGTTLECNDATATYETTAYDTGSQRFYYLSVELGILPLDPNDLVGEADYLVGSVQGSRRLVAGWHVNPVDRGPKYVGDATDNVNSWWTRYVKVGSVTDLSNRTSIKVEWSGSTDNVTYTTYARLMNGGEITSYRYYKFKVTMTGDAAGTDPGIRIALNSMRCRISRARVFDTGSVTTSTGGAVTVTLAHTIPTGFSVATSCRQASGGEETSITSPTTTTFDVSQFNSAGARVAKTVYWHIIV